MNKLSLLAIAALYVNSGCSSELTAGDRTPRASASHPPSPAAPWLPETVPPPAHPIGDAVSTLIGEKTDLSIGDSHPDAIGDFTSSSRGVHVWVRLDTVVDGHRVFLLCDESPGPGPRIGVTHFRARLKTKGGSVLSPVTLELGLSCG